jgi:hypothetical protein
MRCSGAAHRARLLAAAAAAAAPSRCRHWIGFCGRKGRGGRDTPLADGVPQPLEKVRPGVLGNHNGIRW